MEFSYSTDKNIFISLVKNRADIPVFLSPAWLDIVGHSASWDVIFLHNDGNLMAFFIYPRQKKFGFYISIMPTLTYFTGLWLNPSFNKEQHLFLTEELVKSLPTFHYQKLVLNYSNYELSSFKTCGFEISEKITLVISKENKDFYKNYNPKLRSDIVFAKKHLRLKTQNESHDLFSAIEQTFKKQNQKPPFQKALIDNIIQSPLIEKKIYTAIDEEGKIHASMMTIEDGLTVYNILSGRNDFAVRGAVSFLLNEAIQEAIGKDKSFDFEGSSLPGVKAFYESFGGIIKNPVIMTKSKNKWIEFLIKLYKS